MGFWQDEEFAGALNGVSDPVVTPALDQLAHEGAVFTDAIANYPLCSPFRGMLLSGMFPHKNGVTNNTRVDRPHLGLRQDITTLTAALAEAGYDTALIGKGHWHNNLPLFDEHGVFVGTSSEPGGHFMRGTRYDTYIPPGPGRHGIEYWYQTLGHNHDSPMVYTNDTAISGKPDGHPFFPKVYSAVDQADVIIDYIRNNRQQRNSGKPFSILWTMDPPHSPYKEMDDTDEAIFDQYYKHIAIEKLLNRPNVDVETAEQFARFHFSMVTLIDRELGRVLDALGSQGLAQNTLIVFTSDHGEMMGSHSKMAKNEVYEESLGIPLILHFPKRIEPQLSDILIGVPDFMPTILGALGLEESIPGALDGRDYSSYLLREETHLHDKPRSSLYYGKFNELGVRTEQYTFAIDYNGQVFALFDNENDPYQLNSLSLSDLPETDSQLLRRELGQWLARIGHPYARKKTFSDLIIYPLHAPSVSTGNN